MNQDKHRAECLARWQALEAEAQKKWGDYKRKKISRTELEGWLKQQSEMDERTIRATFNKMRG